VVIDEEDCAMVVAYPKPGGSELDANEVAAKINADIQQNKAATWTMGQAATC
jgi:hypothetical protein